VGTASFCSTLRYLDHSGRKVYPEDGSFRSERLGNRGQLLAWAAARNHRSPLHWQCCCVSRECCEGVTSPRGEAWHEQLIVPVGS
jgi:hypothetical protein